MQILRHLQTIYLLTYLILLLWCLIVIVPPVVGNSQIARPSNVSSERIANQEIVAADAEFVRKAQLIALVSSISNCPTVEIQDWTGCIRCRQYGKSIERTDQHLNRTGKVEYPPGFEYVTFIHMQRSEQYNSGFIALQHSVQDATTKALHPLAKTIIIAMPGSTSNADWIDNWRLWSTDFNLPGWNGAIVHAGFMSGFRKIWGQVKGAVRRLSEMYPDYNIIVTGHSRAAPISVLTAVFIIEELKLPLAKVEAWPIGSPRFVNLEFNQILLQKKIQVFSIQNEGDPVANLPPAWWGFHRVPREVLVTRRSLDLKTGKELPPYIRSSRAKTYICYDLFGLEDPRCIDQLSKEEDFDKHLRFKGWGVFGDVFFGYGTYQCNVPNWTDKLRKILNETGDFV